MRVSVAWLKDLVKGIEDESVATIAERLTMAGLEVDLVDDLEQALQDVVITRIVSVTPHPDADKLVVCQVEDGSGTVTVVCGAPNTAEGALVALARPGAVLGGRAVEVATLRGVPSHGMLCSERELGLGDDHAGILILDGDLVPGTPLVQALGIDPVVLELSVTPNRPDALSHVGVARELAALTGGRAKVPGAAPAERGGPVDDAASVSIADPDACPRYACRVVDEVHVGPSPAWLKWRLQRLGVRSINNVVDATNLVLLERGHPLHAFDADRLGHERGRAAIVVRRAAPDEKLRTLDGIERTLDPDDLLICDVERPVALAGIMGGADTEVSTKTTRVLIESAYFAPAVVRRTARRHGLHTEASHRFERGCDPNRGVEDSLNRVAQLIAELSAGTVRRGVVDVYPKKIQPRVVSLRPSRVAALLGVPAKNVSEAEIGTLLGALGLEVASREGEALHLRVPTWRPDLEREIDLVEEVVRLQGMDRVPATLPRGSGRIIRTRQAAQVERVEQLVRDVLLDAGYHEAVSLAFVSPAEDALFRAPGDGPPLKVRNALGEDQSLMRRSLRIRLLAALAVNQRRGVDDVRMFEVGKVFLGLNDKGHGPRPADPDGPSGGDAYAIEERRVAGVAVGKADPHAFDVPARPLDVFDLKGAIEELLAALGHDPADIHAHHVVFEPCDDVPGLHPRCCARVRVEGTVVGVLGEVHPDVVQALDLRGQPYAFELDADALGACARLLRPVQVLPRFPKVRRDVALVIDDGVTVDALLGVVRDGDTQHRGLLVDVDVFDVYRGPHVPPGKKSVALAFEYRAPDRTLVDDEVTVMHGALVETLVQRFQAEVRR
ncbi:MAG: phenylalanine--tRNA ligase subunit beta [Pseudomonadota bacterium]